MNSLFKGSNGATFGIEDDTVTLQSIIYMEALTQEAFTVQAVTFLEALATALEGFEAVVERSVNAVPESLEDSLISMQNMIRI
ncbi:MAG: type III secretion system chaperone, partial [Bacteroidales bacterium]|nr:type III secretion system chaperone [Bacteroidales bacterium]